MCCFNHPVDHVYSTRIFVGARDGRQLTVYSAALVGSRIEMVLPVRTRGAAEIEFIDLKGYPDFFQDCARAFARPARGRSRAGAAEAATTALLEVQQVGDYKVSFAPGRRDLERADPSVFQLSERLKRVLAAHYPADEFGYVIYKPDHNGEMHPLGYRHAVKPGDSLFVPTRHEHGHEGPPDWDHYIYHQGDASHVRATLDTSPRAAGAVFQAAVNAGKPVPPELDLGRPLLKLERHGARYPNEDLEIVPTRVSASPRQAMLGAGVAAGAAAGYHLLRKGR